MNRWLLCCCVILASPAWGAQDDLNRETQRVRDQQKAPLSAKDIVDLQTRGWRDRRVGEFDPPVSNTSRPADYLNDGHRGLIEFTPLWRNYAWHTVKIPDGTVIDRATMRACNFTQLVPDTDAILRLPGFGHNLTFRGCNLVNVRTYPDWTIESSNTTQVDMIGAILPDGTFDKTDQVVVGSSASKVNKFRLKPNGVLE